MKLPEIGEEVTLQELTNLAANYSKSDILTSLLEIKVGELSKFSSDGCSMWPDSWFGTNIYDCCFWHDVRYWCGKKGDDAARVLADAHLAIDVAAKGEPNLARMMFTGVGFGGSENIDSPFKWGYGRS